MRKKYLLVFLLLLLPIGGCNLLNLADQNQDQADDQNKTDDQKPAPAPTPKPAAEAEYWEALAKLVEADRFQNTDQILGVVSSQKDLGNIKDDARVSEFKKKRLQIDANNRAQVAAKIRGK